MCCRKMFALWSVVLLPAMLVLLGTPVGLSVAGTADGAGDLPPTEIMQIPGPDGPLEGAALIVPGAAAGVVIIPGSGPTDRDGNAVPFFATDTYRQLAEGLARSGISSVRIDKRGLYGSRHAVPDPEDVTLRAYAQDAAGWHDALAAHLGRDCVWIAGHSEGGLVALRAAAGTGDPAGQPLVRPCGLVLLAAPGRRTGQVLLDQFARGDATRPHLPVLKEAIARLERGQTVDPGALHPVVRNFFRHSIQSYLIDLLAVDPAVLARSVAVPVLVIHGGADIQVLSADADALRSALPDARTVGFSSMTHMLKRDVPGAPYATYLQPDLPLSPGLVTAVSEFILGR